MAVRRKQSNDEYLDFDDDKTLEQQIGDLGLVEQEQPDQLDQPQQVNQHYDSLVGKQLQHTPQAKEAERNKQMAETVQTRHLSRVGEQIQRSTEIRDGWMAVDKALLGGRAKFYPEDWEFMVRPATVEAIRNWSTIDDENWSSVDDVLNEILKSCLAIKTSEGPKPWNSINSWDRLFFILLVHQYTFAHGEKKIELTAPCPNCDEDVNFRLTATTVGYEMPDEEVMPYFDAETRTWNIYPQEFDVDTTIEKVTLYVPTLEREANWKSWLFAMQQRNRNFKFDAPFQRFAVWLCPKISKDATIARQQMKQAETLFKSWDADMFSFMDDVLKNVVVVPNTYIKTTCPTCGEEVTMPIEFQNGIRDLFTVASRHKKFGKK